MGHELKSADALFVLSSYDPRVPRYAARLYHESYAPLVLIAGTGEGHQHDLMATDFGMKEGEYFAKVMKEEGVPESAMVLELESKNTGQNFEYMGRKLDELGLDPKVVICVQKPFMERRVYATGKVWWPERELIVTSPSLTFEEYFDGSDKPKDEAINIMVGDLERIIEYPKRGFQIEQSMPQSVHNAFRFLIDAGYTRHLIK